MTAWIAQWLGPHLIVVPIILPVLTAAVMLLLGEQRRRIKATVNVASTLAGLLVAVTLLRQVKAGGDMPAIGVYLPSNWDLPFGIVLAVDHLSALMLVLTSVLALGALLFAVARWDRAGVHFHPLFQIQVMGLSGAFLTADLFNLFVFFEVMLAASYGLLLHATGRARVTSGLHYIAINLVASSLFLIGVAIIYGITGTLTMADLAQKVPLVSDADRGLLHAGAAVLGIAFLIKAAMWPLNFWLVPAYAAASAPVAGLFAIMTKVGLYAVLRLWTLVFPEDGSASERLGSQWIVYGGLCTMAFGALGMMSSIKLSRLGAYAVMVSSGTLLAAFGMGEAALTGRALYYLVSSTVAVSAFMLVVELVERSRFDKEGTAAASDIDEYDHIPFPVEALEYGAGTNLDDEEEVLIGKAIPAAMAFLGLSFIACTLLIAGMPPLSGFVGKFAMLSALLNPDGLDVGGAGEVGAAGWAWMVLVIVSGLLSLVALTRAGIRYFWAPQDRPAPRLRVIECLPVAMLIGTCMVLTLRADAVLRYTQAAADSLYEPSRYVDAVMTAQRLPGPTQPARPETGGEGSRP
jgi:multicomponent K+:H+ antiporter subunit D